MTENELRKLKKTQLVELYVEQVKIIEELQEKVAMLETKISDRSIKIEESGSIAEAALKVSGIFESAQAAAQQYIDNIRELKERQEQICAAKEIETTQKCDAREKEVYEKCAILENETTERCAILEQETISKCASLEKKITEKCAALEVETAEKCRMLEDETNEKCALLEKETDESVAKKWDDLSGRLNEFILAQDGLKEVLEITGASRNRLEPYME